MNYLHSLYTFIDLAGTFAFALSGAVAAKNKGLDIFGILVVAFTVACGGGIIRDLCIGAVPPAGISDWRYLATAMVAALITMSLNWLSNWLIKPVLLFDALGLSLFAVSGAQKALEYGHNYEVAVLLGMITAVGGGVMRDILLNRIPAILEKEIYASAALVGALIVVLGTYIKWLSNDWIAIIALIVCFTLRMLALRFHWNLPSFSKDKNKAQD